VRGFLDREFAPHSQQWEADRWFPDEVFPKLAAQGLLGLKYPTELGGQGGDYLHEAVLVEELSRIGSGGTAAGIGAHINIATPPIWKFGTDEHKQQYLVPAIRGEKIGALAITEPDAGSDVAALRTNAERVDGGWVVNGEKTYITNGVRAHFMVTAVKTRNEDPPSRHHDISFLIIDRTEGVSSSKLEKLGWHASDTATISFENVFVPEQNLLGELNEGFKLIMANFQWERLAMALGTVGAMQLAYQRTAEYARERTTFGKPLSKHQAIKHKLADMYIKNELARSNAYFGAWALETGAAELPVAAAASRVAACEAFWFAAKENLQTHGGMGFTWDVDCHLFYRRAQQLGLVAGGAKAWKERLVAQLERRNAA